MFLKTEDKEVITIGRIFDKNKKKIGSFKNDTIYDANDKIVGYRDGEYIVDSRAYEKILYKIHDDGYITEDTSGKILGRITEDGTILEGTSRKIAGEIELGDSNASDIDSEIGWFLIVMCIFFVIAGVYFSIFKLPSFVSEQFKEMIESQDIVELVTFSVFIMTEVISNIVGNMRMKKAKYHLIKRIKGSFKISFYSGVVALFLVCPFLSGTAGTFIVMVLAIPIVAAMFAILPALIVSTVFFTDISGKKYNVL